MASGKVKDEEGSCWSNLFFAEEMEVLGKCGRGGISISRAKIH